MRASSRRREGASKFADPRLQLREEPTSPPQAHPAHDAIVAVSSVGVMAGGQAGPTAATAHGCQWLPHGQSLTAATAQEAAATHERPTRTLTARKRPARKRPVGERLGKLAARERPVRACGAVAAAPDAPEALF